jgi:hypothetical protein
MHRLRHTARTASTLTGRNLIATIFAAVFVTLGLYVLLWWRRTKSTSASALTWPTTNGVITQSHIRYPAAPDDTALLVLAFEYTVGVTHYSSNRLDLFHMEERSTQEEMEALTRRYPKEQSVQVYFDPAKPTTGVLEPGNLVAAHRVRNLGLVLIAIGLIAFAVDHWFGPS